MKRTLTLNEDCVILDWIRDVWRAWQAENLAFADACHGYDPTQPWWVYAPPGVTDASAWMDACRLVDPTIPAVPRGYRVARTEPERFGHPAYDVCWPTGTRIEMLNVALPGWEPWYVPCHVVDVDGRVVRAYSIRVTRPVLVDGPLALRRWHYIVNR